MDDRMREQLEGILKQADLEDQSELFLRQALAIDIPREDGPWLKSLFRMEAIILETVFGKRRGTRMLAWWLFSLGIAYERHKYADRHPEKGGD